MSHEVQTRTCRDCKENKTRIQFGSFPKGKNKRWIDENGKQWSGTRCPDCQRKKALENMQRLRCKVEDAPIK